MLPVNPKPQTVQASSTTRKPEPLRKRIKNFLNIKRQLELRKQRNILNSTDKKRRVLIVLFRQLYIILKDVDKKLGSRRARKQFWSEFAKHGRMRLNLIEQLMQNVDPKGTYRGEGNWNKNGGKDGAASSSVQN